MAAHLALIFPLAASLLLAAADTGPVERAQREELSLQQFGAQNPACKEWSDGCSSCLRNGDGVAHCSTPGIACQPEAIVCKAPKP